MDDAKKYNKMENILQSINREYVSFSDEETLRNNVILNNVLDEIVSKMRQKDKLFNSAYRKIFFGGSYYDGLKVGSPDEYDIDLLLKFDKNTESEVSTSNKPGFVHVKLTNSPDFSRLCIGCYLDTDKVLSWIEGVLQRALNDFPRGTDYWYSFQDICHEDVYGKIVKQGPAFTLQLMGYGAGQFVKMSVDLVPCFEFGESKWPRNGFKPNPYPKLQDFFIVPKHPKGLPNYGSRYWRLSLQAQERCLINQKEKLKPALRLLKKMRDTQRHDYSISSYYLKTVAMWEANEQTSSFWYTHSMSYIFMHILKKYKECLSNGKILYFWNKKYNLLTDIRSDTLINISNRLGYIIRDIDNKIIVNPETVAKYLHVEDDIEEEEEDEEEEEHDDVEDDIEEEEEGEEEEEQDETDEDYEDIFVETVTVKYQSRQLAPCTML